MCRYIKHFLSSVCIARRKEGNVLFNDALNTFYLQLYGVGHMVKDHSDSERGNLLPPLHGLLFPFNSKGLCYTSRGSLAGTRNNMYWNMQQFKSGCAKGWGISTQCSQLP